MRRPWTFGLALLLPFLLPAAALALDPGGVFQVTESPGAFPSAALGHDGSFVVSWVGPGLSVSARHYAPSGTPRTGEFQVGEINATYPGGTATTVDRSGFLVVWGNEPKFSNSYVLGQRYDRKSQPLLDEPFSRANTTGPHVASDPRGNSVLVGVELGPLGSGSKRIVAIRRNAQGRQVGDVIPVSGPGFAPEVTVDTAGNFVVAWEGARGIYARRFSAAGSPRGEAFKVTANVSRPTLAGNRRGQFAVAWRNGSSLWARFYSSSGEARTGPVRVANRIVESTNVSAAMDAEGKVLVTWNCCSFAVSPPSALYGRWFERSGAPSGARFRISSGPYAFQPDAASGPANQFLVVWQGAIADTPPRPAILGRLLDFGAQEDALLLGDDGL